MRRSRSERDGCCRGALRALGVLVVVLFALGVLVVVLSALVAPSSARAWTDSSVRSAKVVVTVAADGTARVAMRVSVRVSGGWLEGLELAGLDPALVLDAAAPTLVTGEDGAVYVPTVVAVADGTDSTRVQLTFPRQSAPRRGAYEVALAYRTSLAHRATQPSADGASVRVSWTLPPWQTGLDGVELTLDLPGAARPAEALDPEGDNPTAQVSVVVEGGRTQLRWRRPHLPRTTVWTIAADVPAASLASTLRRARAEPTGVPQVRGTAPAWPIALVVALVLLSLGTLTRRARAAALWRAGLGTAPLVGMPSALRTVSCFVLVVLAPCATWAHPAAAVLPLTLLLAVLLVRAAPASDSPDRGLGDVRNVGKEDLRAAARAVFRARWLTLDALLDGTTWPGRLVVVALGASALFAQALCASNDAAPLFVLGAALACVPLFVQTHGGRRRTPAEALQALGRIASRLRVPEDAPLALGFTVTTGEHGLDSARLEVVASCAPPGLWALQIVLAESAHGVTLATEPALLAVTCNGSDAEGALAALRDAATTCRGETYTTRLAPCSSLDVWVRALAGVARARAVVLDADDLRDDESTLSALLFDEPDYRDGVLSSARSARSASS